MIPLYNACQSLGILQRQAADVGQPLLQESLLDAVPVGEDGGLLLPEIHIQACIPACHQPQSSDARIVTRLNNSSKDVYVTKDSGVLSISDVVNFGHPKSIDYSP